MSNTYTKIYLHIVFAVKNRESLMAPLTQQRLHLYFASTLQTMGNYPLAIGGVADHVHILIEYKPTISIPDMVRQLKTASTKLLNDNKLTLYHFAWQRGYACFSYSPSQIEAVKKYILNQPQHHNKMTLSEEIHNIYDRFGIEYDPRYTFTDP